jgi:SAM-dependent methyltransferase
MGDVVSPEFEGILIPTPEIGQERFGVTRQFLEDADEYHRKYNATAYFKALLEAAFARCDFTFEAPVILDIGSGSGNSVFPCLEIFDDPRIIATDISPDLLKILAGHVEDLGHGDRVIPVCMDATRDLYVEESFDLVVGAAILHHLINPEDALRAGLRALRPGGHAIFFEPLEAGHAVLRLAYKEILADRSGQKSDERPALDVLAAQVQDIELRTGTDKSDPVFARLDDKWLFTRSHIEEIALRSGASRVDIQPLHVTATPFSDQTRTNLRLAAGLPPEALADWAWKILQEYDTAFSQELLNDLAISGTIILTQ